MNKSEEDDAKTIQYLKFNQRQDLFRCFNKSHCIVGPTECGKTVLVHYLIYLNRDIPKAQVFCGSYQASSDYRKIIDERFVSSSPTEENLREFYDDLKLRAKRFVRQWDELLKVLEKSLDSRLFKRYEKMAAAVKKAGTSRYLRKSYSRDFKDVMIVFTKHFLSASPDRKRRLMGYIDCFIDQRIMVIFDDVTDKKWFTSKQGTVIHGIITAGRHSYITSFFITHSYKGGGFEPAARKGFQYMYILGNIGFFSSFYDEILKNTLKGLPLFAGTTARQMNLKINNLILGLISQIGTAIVARRDGKKTNFSDVISYFRVPITFVKDEPKFTIGEKKENKRQPRRRYLY